jgi:hypothetical protein
MRAHMLAGIIEFAQAVAHENRQLMDPDTCIAINGSCGHRHKAGLHTVDVIDCRSRRLVDFEVGVKEINFPDGNFDEDSNSMEVTGFKRLLPRWLHAPNVRHVATDKNSNFRHEILISRSNVEQKVDANHEVKALI